MFVDLGGRFLGSARHLDSPCSHGAHARLRLGSCACRKRGRPCSLSPRAAAPSPPPTYSQPA
eukprot:9469077-Pyramimonas_sp.AAC.1